MMLLIALMLLSRIAPSLSFHLAPHREALTCLREQKIDRQSDNNKYGRGIEHISADLNEGDVIAYQDGTWYVDGTEVGNGSAATVRYMKVDTVQIVWTHDCEHGLVYGFDVKCDSVIKKGDEFIIQEENYVQCGPEQILCRIPVSSESNEVLISCVDLNPADEIILS
jgi:hypothetical protein